MRSGLAGGKGGMGVGPAVAVGDTGVSVAGTAVGGTGVSVAGTAVAVGRIRVGVGSASFGVALGVAT